MDAVIKAWKTSRKLCLDFFDKYSLDQLNKVPDKFNNNIIWNIGHIIAAQQSIVYKTSNLPINISDNFFDRYKPGTKPTDPVSQSEVDEIKSLLVSMIEQTEKDLAIGNLFPSTKAIPQPEFHLATCQPP